MGTMITKWHSDAENAPRRRHRCILYSPVNLQNGARLGPYEIEGRLGTGGMGEVYRARDVRLQRTVAIKVLPSEFASDATLKARFEREARAISSLNDPHICALYDVGHEDGRAYLVMEYCEGATLADRVGTGKLPLEQVLRFGIQIAEALEKAHRSGVIHRDVKPSNIMITKSGVKLLDFGLAAGQFITGDGRPDDNTAHQVTRRGQILGTLTYMAPEVLRGSPAEASVGPEAGRERGQSFDSARGMKFEALSPISRRHCLQFLGDRQFPQGECGARASILQQGQLSGARGQLSAVAPVGPQLRQWGQGPQLRQWGQSFDSATRTACTAFSDIRKAAGALRGR
jgi:serine/threonine protein kinase